ncbi:hypothetical protein VP01_1117g1 [Puccinia sorghi]|uniref:Uncharacterized protein n=1 Tax=Puccinia sorghi TaxID=27349 RepID=A0A0L6VSH2_9BASI|nr:hypothetical protein VP01_1117g1 [Puccinia sorghi]
MMTQLKPNHERLELRTPLERDPHGKTQPLEPQGLHIHMMTGPSGLIIILIRIHSLLSHQLMSLQIFFPHHPNHQTSIFTSLYHHFKPSFFLLLYFKSLCPLPLLKPKKFRKDKFEHPSQMWNSFCNLFLTFCFISTLTPPHQISLIHSLIHLNQNLPSLKKTNTRRMAQSLGFIFNKNYQRGVGMACIENKTHVKHLINIVSIIASINYQTHLFHLVHIGSPPGSLMELPNTKLNEIQTMFPNRDHWIDYELKLRTFMIKLAIPLNFKTPWAMVSYGKIKGLSRWILILEISESMNFSSLCFNFSSTTMLEFYSLSTHIFISKNQIYMDNEELGMIKQIYFCFQKPSLQCRLESLSYTYFHNSTDLQLEARMSLFLSYHTKNSTHQKNFDLELVNKVKTVDFWKFAIISPPSILITKITKALL